MSRKWTQATGLALSTAILVLATGCEGIRPDRMTREMRKQGVIGWGYVSGIKPDTAREPIPVAIQVLPFERTVPSRTMGMPGGLKRIVPILSLTAPPVVYVNSVQDVGTMDIVEIPEGEPEDLLSKELVKANLFREVNPDLTTSDYQITGRVDFRWERDYHMSGLGFLYIITLYLAPARTNHVTCHAHFEITSRKSRSVILTKDYTSQYQSTDCWGDSDYVSCASLGMELYPKVVVAFLKDVADLPAGKWTE